MLGTPHKHRWQCGVRPEIVARIGKVLAVVKVAFLCKLPVLESSFFAQSNLCTESILEVEVDRAPDEAH